jgi:hypothetical protein
VTNTLASPQLDAVLRRLFAAAANDGTISQAALPPGRASWAEATAAELADAREDHYLPISPEAGTLLYTLARAIRPHTIVEFGTSYGISTLYLAAAVTDNYMELPPREPGSWLAGARTEPEGRQDEHRPWACQDAGQAMPGRLRGLAHVAS